MKDLIVLVPDLDIENVIQEVLHRVPSVCGLRTFSFDIHRHINRDPGCYNESAEFLRPFTQQYHFAIVVFDREGSGQENNSRIVLEEYVERSLIGNGWGQSRVAAISIDPEVENWMWIKSPHVADALGWRNQDELFNWLESQEWLEPNHSKPNRPKEAMEAVLKRTKKPRSSSIYKQIAERASWRNCTDPAFLKMIEVLSTWFNPSHNLPHS